MISLINHDFQWGQWNRDEIDPDISIIYHNIPIKKENYIVPLYIPIDLH
jgi:hypothetical protein